MATVKPRHERNDPNAGMQGAYYTVDIAQSGFLDTETINGGRCSPCAANDFATKPTTLAQSLLVSRGQLRFRMMLQNLQIRSNCRIINMVTTYASDAGDNPITDINFGIVFENDDFVPNTGTAPETNLLRQPSPPFLSVPMYFFANLFIVLVSNINLQ